MVVLCVRPCSITARLPCVAEGAFFFHRGGYGGRPIALRNRAKVCVFAGAPRRGVGCEGWKRRVFDVNFQRLVNMVENDAFGASAR